MEMERKERMIKLLKQYLLLCAGLAVMAFGVALSIKAALGTSRALCGQHVHAVYGGYGDHRDALRIHRPSDPDPAQAI